MAKKRRRFFGRRRRAAGGAPRRRRGFGRRRRTRGRSLGLAGKAGFGIAVGAPIVYGGIDTAERVSAVMRAGHADLVGGLKVGFWTFLNGITQGFGGAPIREKVTVLGQDNQPHDINVVGDVPAGAWYKTSVPGALLIAWDILSSWAARRLAGIRSAPRLFGMKLAGGK